VIGGFEAPNSGSHFEMSSSSLTAPSSTKVMNVMAVSHFVEEATSIGVVPDMSPMVCSWITAPSSATILIMPRDCPAARTRSSRSASVASKVSGAKTLRTVVVAVAAVVTPTGVEVGMGDDVAAGAVGLVESFIADDPQPTSSSPDATNATAHLDTMVNVPPPNRPASSHTFGNGRSGTDRLVAC